MADPHAGADRDSKGATVPLPKEQEHVDGCHAKRSFQHRACSRTTYGGLETPLQLNRARIASSNSTDETAILIRFEFDPFAALNKVQLPSHLRTRLE